MNDVLEPPDETGRSLPTTAAGVPARHDPDTPPVDVAAYSAFYRTEVKALVNFLLWMGAGLADATDIAQETMIEAYQSWPSILHPRAWTRRVASRRYGRRRFGQEVAIEPERLSPLLPACADISAWEQRHEVLRLLAMLPWRQRQVIAWTFDGYRPQEIADELDITPEAVRASLKLARRALAEQLGRAEEPYEPR
ncbi:sigma-70 family RNA polymerase sigma factor [Micromonospora sp. WMMC264]|uniref:RNA polymerase sigma factor n=1 Tax=Micromonospora sp. WMMC264 TaxID=3015158 RepID=UPI00248CDBAE|nr:sigma-70 family RNA polymerase sigma factor [Micromonospora sp. WMMC264]WBB88168.1 sigma-70 family RNA polymerase sigma factor [Micromonospora sp. WMMC264]